MKNNDKEIFGEYELVELIGDGAQGKVFKARRLKPAPGAPVFFAIKMLRLMGDDEEKVEKFHRQADILRRLCHPNIVSYIDTFTWNAREWDESHCLVMEYLDGETLADRIRGHPHGIPWDEVREIFERCLEALIYARSESVVHRDIKPSNIFLDIHGGVKIIDFDIARHEASAQASTVGWKGTFDYMAPDFVTEQNFRGDEQSDIFSLGVCFYQALTGSLPFSPLGEGAQIGYLNRWQHPDAVEVLCEHGIFRALVNASRFTRMSIAPRRENRLKSFSEQLEHLRAIRCRTLEHRHKDTYELTGGLGRGALAETFLARRLRDGHAVVVKELFTGVTSRDFIRGIKVLRKYPHPGIVKHLDFIAAAAGRGEKKFFLVLEALRGTPDMLLSQRLLRGSKLPLREALPLFCQYLSALGFLHEDPRPIVHADIRPSGLYAPLGRPELGKLLDLGVDRDAARKLRPLCSPWVLDYMAPEFASGGGRGLPQSDIYALGMCLYEALTGEPPFPRLPLDPEQGWSLFTERASAAPPVSFDAEIFRHYPRVAEILRRALAADPADRYRTAEDMRHEIESAIRELKAQDTEQAARETARDESEAWTSGSLEAATMPPMVTMPVGAETSAEKNIDWSAMRTRDTRRRRFKRFFLTMILLGASAGAGWFFATWRQETVLTRLAQEETQRIEQQQIAEAQSRLANILGDLSEPRPAIDYVEDLAAAERRIHKLAAEDTVLSNSCLAASGHIRELGGGVPALFREAIQAAAAEGRIKEAETLIRQWEQAAEFGELLGVSEDEHRRQSAEMSRVLGNSMLAARAKDIAALLPASLRTKEELASAEKATVLLKQAPAEDWPGIAPEAVGSGMAEVKQSLQDLLHARLKELRLAADKLAEEQRPLQPAIDRLADLKTAAPQLSAMFRDDFSTLESAFDSAAARVETALAEKEAAGIAAEKEAARIAAEKEAAGIAVERAAARTKPREKESPEEDTVVEAPAPEKDLPETPPAAPAQPKQEAPPEPVEAEIADEGEARLLAALDGDLVYLPPEKTTIDKGKAANLLEAARATEKGLEVTDLAMSRQATESFLASVADFWAQSSAFEGESGGKIVSAAWHRIHRELTRQAAALLSGGPLLRTPGQKAQVRIKFMQLLVRVENITGRVADCEEGDALRDTIALFCESDVDRSALLSAWNQAGQEIEARLPWIASILSDTRD